MSRTDWLGSGVRQARGRQQQASGIGGGIGLARQLAHQMVWQAASARLVAEDFGPGPFWA